MSLLELRGITVPNSNLRDFDMDVRPEECLVVFGTASMGKRAVLKLAAGALIPLRGRVRLDVPGGEGPLPVSYAPQAGGLINNMSLLQNVVLPVVYHRIMPHRDAEKRGQEILEKLGAGFVSGSLPSMVATTPQRMAKLARALLVHPALYVLEDPLADLDAAAMRTVRRVLRELKAARGAAVMVSTGDPKLYLDWADRFVHLRKGGVTVFESKEELRASKDLEVQQFLS